MKLISIIKKDFLILIRNKGDMIVLFLMPLAFIIPISLALGSGDGYGIQSDNTMIRLPVANYDGGPRAQDLMATIGESLLLETSYTAEQIQSFGLRLDPICFSETPRPDCLEKAARNLVERSRRRAILIIPAGFSEKIDGGLQARIDLFYDPAGDSTQMQQIQGVIKGAALKISIKNQVNDGLDQLNDLVVYAPQAIQESMQSEANQEDAQNQQPAISLQKVAPKNYHLTGTPDTYQQTIPGYTVMYVFFIISTVSDSIRQEKLNGTFRRLLSSPTSRAEIVAGKLLAVMGIGLIQVLLMFLVGVMLFDLNLGEDPLAFLFLTITLVLTAASLGLAVSSGPLKESGMGAPLIISALLGGCMFPLDLMPNFLRVLSYIIPHSWALQGYQNLMVRGMGLQDILPQIGALLGFSLIFFLFTLWQFRFDD